MAVERVAQRCRCSRLEVDEEEALPVVDVDGLEAERRAVDLVLLDAWCGDECSVQVVAPGVVRALEDGLGLAACVVAEHGPAVAADVVERAELAVVVARDQDALSRDVDGEELSRVSDLLGASGVDPLLVPELLLLDGVLLRGVVVVGRQGVAASVGASMVMVPPSSLACLDKSDWSVSQ